MPTLSVCTCASCVVDEGSAFNRMSLERRAAHLKRTASTAVTTMSDRRPTTSPHNYDTPEIKKLSDTFERVKQAQPDLSPYDALMAATKIVDGKKGLDDAGGRVVLHSMALRHMRETGRRDYAAALMAVSREYSELTATSQLPAHVIEGEQLDAAARRLMTERPGTSYRDALLEAGRRRYMAGTANRPSKTRGTAPTGADPVGEDPHPDLPTVQEVEDYAKKKGLLYKVAMVQLTRIRAGLDPDGGQD